MGARWTDSTGTALRRPDGTSHLIRNYGRGMLNEKLAQSFSTGISMGDLSSATFAATGGSGAYDAGASSYGNVPILLTVNAGSTGNSSRASWSTGYGLGGFMEDGGVFTVVAEIVSGFVTGDTLKVIISSDGAATKTLTATYTINKNQADLIFFNFYGANDIVVAGGESWSSTMNYIAVRAGSEGGTTGGVMKIHGLFKYQRRRPFCVIQFDDGLIDQYKTVFAYMSSKGFVGDIAVGKDYTDPASYCTTAQLGEMYRAGWDMVVHGVKNHNDGSLTTSALLRAEIAYNQNHLLANGWTRGAYEYVYPGGIINASTDSKAQLTALGFRTSRLVTTGFVYPSRWGLSSPLALNGRDLSGAYSAASDLALLDRAIDNCSGVIFFGHKIVRLSPGANEMTFAEFKTLIDGISDRVRDGKLDVLTQAQMADRYLTA